MSNRQDPDLSCARDSGQQAPVDDRGFAGISRGTLELWKKVNAEGLEFLHQHKDSRSRTPSVDELIQEAEEQRTLHEHMHGLRIVPERPHEYAFALVLRPFSRPALNGEIPLITASRLSPGYCFIGLERAGNPAIPAGSIKSHRISSAEDMKAAVEIAAAARPEGFVFFEAADHIWQDVVAEFARSSAAILIDLSETTKGLEWELETLVPKYRERFVCYAINAESGPFGPWQERLPAGLEVQPIVSRLGTTVAGRMFPDLLSKRVSHDKAIVYNCVSRAMRTTPWGQDFTAGLEAFAVGDLNKASHCLKLAWDCATRRTPHPVMLVYPGVALADVLTLEGNRSMRRSVFEGVLGIAAGPHPTTEFERHKTDVALIRQLLRFTHSALPLAIWQFYAVLGGGLSSELLMTYYLQVAIEWESRMGPPTDDLAAGMLSWNADAAVRLARQLKAPYVEVRALLPAAAARKTLGDVAGCLERARAGAELAARSGDTPMERSFAALLASGA